MQDIADLKSTLFATQEQQVQLCDERDGKIYWTSKLADGNVWMTQNLDLDITEFKHLTPSDSDVDKDIEIDIEKFDHLLDSSPYEDGGDFYYPDGNSYQTPVSTNFLSPNSPNWHYSVGSLYNWNIATANGTIWLELEDFANTLDEYCGSFSETPDYQCLYEHYDDYFSMAVNSGLINDEEADELVAEMKSIGGMTIEYTDEYFFRYFYDSHDRVLPNSICPKGWKLPSNGSDDGGVDRLLDYYFDFMHEPFYGVIEINYLVDEILNIDRKSLGTFWTTGQSIGIGSSNDRDSIRCVAR